MAADDIIPSRFVATKEALSDLIGNLDGYNASIITFSGIPFIYVPFSTDTNAILQKRNTTNLGDFPPTEDFVGTAIGDALLLGISNLDKIRGQDPEYPGIIILITDGDSNKGYDPIEVLGLIQKKKVPVFTLGVGESDYLIGFDKRASPVKTSINIQLLQEISKQT
ncbi:VWA domain-containing protein [Patescibacteria group bacterium]|nr:VWA domain-containing protein [Patescibacteria group bacterium]MBU1757708.1 VWA domain-containing protein [Patescibacteria group bacterium]